MRAAIFQAVIRAKDAIIQNMSIENITTTGKTAESIKVVDEGDSIVMYSTEKGAPFETVQYGRPGGRVPRGFEKIIEKWIIDKGLSINAIPYKRKPSELWQPKYTPEMRGLKAAAGAIANKIRREGTERYNTPNERVYSQVLDALEEEVLKAVDNATITINIKR